MRHGRLLVGILLLALVAGGGALRFAQSGSPGHRLVPDEEEYGRPRAPRRRSSAR
jgi:hypothetical protein